MLRNVKEYHGRLYPGIPEWLESPIFQTEMSDKFRMAQEQVSHSDDSDGEGQSDLSCEEVGDESYSLTPGPVLGLLINWKRP